MLAAVEHLFDRRNAEFRAAFAKRARRRRSPAGRARPVVAHPRRRQLLRLARARRRRPHRREARQNACASSAPAPRSSVEQTFREIFPPPTAPNPFFDAGAALRLRAAARARARSPARRRRRACRRRRGARHHQAPLRRSPFARRSAMSQTATATATATEIPLEESRHGRESYEALLARLSRQSVNEALRVLSRHRLGRARDAHRPRRSALGAPADRPARRHRLVSRAAAGRARAPRALPRRHVHEGRAAVRERAQPGPACASRSRAASSRPSSATPITSSSRSRTTR